MTAYNIWSDVSGIANAVQDDAVLIVRELGQMQNFVTTFRDLSGMNPRKGYKYNNGTAKSISDADDLTSDAFTPSVDQTLTPGEIGEQFFISDQRADSSGLLPENVLNDASTELGLAALDKIETDLITDLDSLTGGSLGASGTAITWGYVAAAIAQARNANKSNSIPLTCVIHAYQASVLAKAASVAGATSISQAPGVTEEITRRGLVPAFNFLNVPIYQVFGGISGSDFTGGVFPKSAIAIDWRRAIRVEQERDASRRGVELNMSGVYAHGVWRPARGVKFIFSASAPTA